MRHTIPESVFLPSSLLLRPQLQFHLLIKSRQLFQKTGKSTTEQKYNMTVIHVQYYVYIKQSQKTNVSLSYFTDMVRTKY